MFRAPIMAVRHDKKQHCVLTMPDSNTDMETRSSD